MNRVRILATTLALCGLLLPLPALGQVQAFGSVPSESALLQAVAPGLPLLTQPVELAAPLRMDESPDYSVAEPILLAPQARVRNRRGIPLMVAGGALFVAGAIIGKDAGTILMVGGAGVGAWGAYVYFGG